STRKLYEKKIYEYESQRTKFPAAGAVGSSYTCGDNYGNQDYPRQDEEEDLEEVDYDNYYEESYSTTKTYREADDDAAAPFAKARTSLQDPLPPTSFSSDSPKKPTYHLRQRIRENFLYPLSQEEDVDR
ncbi:emerin, partial [Gracilinanus agilis]|uniref:emerin n=1 Tax=Gracilinanus agilis TaxID=191870 RepID=UPI001CFE6FE1